MEFSVQAFALALCSYGPGLVLFGKHASEKSHTICLFIGSSFCFYMTLVFCSFLWFGVKLNSNLYAIEFIFNVVVQEVIRYFWFTLVRQTDFHVLRYLEKLNPYRHAKYAYICGLGYGMASNIFQVSNLVRDLIGPGAVGLKTTQNEYFIVIMGLLCLTNFSNQVLWSVIMYYGNFHRDYLTISYVVGSHLLLSLVNLAAKGNQGIIPLICSTVVCAISIYLGFRILPNYISYVKDIQPNGNGTENSNDISEASPNILPEESNSTTTSNKTEE